MTGVKHDIYQHNLSVLKKTEPALYRQLKKFFSSSLQESSHRNLSILSDQTRKIEAILAEGMDFLYVLGVDSSDFLLQISNRIINKNRGICVLEPRLDRFASFLHHHELDSLFPCRRIFWAVGEEIKDQIRFIWKNTYCYAAASPAYVFGDPDDETLQSLFLWMKEEIAVQKSDAQRQIKSLPQRLAHSWKGVQKIWSYADLRGKAGYSLIQHVLIRTLMYELRNRGYQVEYTVLHSGGYYPPYYRFIKLAEFEPDLIFLCNETPSTEISLGKDFSRSLPIPKVTWFADDPLYAEHLLKRYPLGQDETMGVADIEWADTLRMHGAKNIFFMPGAATKIRRGRFRKSMQCEVVFVGQVRDQKNFFAQLSPAWQKYCKQVIQEKLKFPRKKVRDVMAQFTMPAELAPDYLDEFRQKLLWEANTLFRVQMIRTMLDYDLHVYGNEAWLTLIPDETFKRCYKGVLPFKKGFDLSASASIVLNIHSLQSYTCLNVRDFDVPAAGGFLLSDWLPRADEIYVPGFVSDLPLQQESNKDVFFYRSIAELRILVDYFLVHEEIRLSCVERAREKVLNQHTYGHRAQLLDKIFYSLDER